MGGKVKSEYIIKKISEYFNIEESLIFSKFRRQDLVKARHYIIYYMHHYGDTLNSPSNIRNVFKEKGCTNVSAIPLGLDPDFKEKTKEFNTDTYPTILAAMGDEIVFTMEGFSLKELKHNLNKY